MSNINYLAGADAALVKLGVTRDWVRQRVRDAVRKGVPVDRMDDFASKMKATTSRARHTADTLPSSNVHRDLWRIPKTEPHPFRPDYAEDFYREHAKEIGHKARDARVELYDAQYGPQPVPPLITRRENSVGQPGYKHLRSDKYDLRHKLEDVSDDTIEAARPEPGSYRTVVSSPDYARTRPLGSREAHPRGTYLSKLEDLAAQPDRPGDWTVRQEISRKRALRKAQGKKWDSREEAAAARRDINDEYDSYMPEKPAYAGPYRDTASPTSPADTAPSNLKRNALLAGAALAVPTAGYAAYKHYSPDKAQG